MLFAAVVAPLSALAQDSLVRFEGGIGVVPVSSAAGVQNANGTFPDVNRNDVRGVQPGGQPWVISRLTVEVKIDGRISVDGRGLLLAGGNGIGTNGNQSVQARLLSALPPDPCESAILLIVSAADRWFAAGIPRR